VTAAKDTALVLRKDEPLEVIVTRLGERPESTLEMATSMATALADVVEKQHLYSTIKSKKKDGSYEFKKYPTVEAWMTIARMDNVVAREAEPPIRHEDGSYEAFTELLRLSDGMVVGRGSALCGTKGDYPWDGRPEPQRRSMAVTRATSRAFRQQYSWIMALAGYEPTPAEEMPDGKDQRPVGAYDTPPDRPELERMADGLIGTAEVGKTRDSDFELRKSGDDEHFVLGFKLKSNGGGFKVLTRDELALQLLDVKDDVVGKRLTVWGRVRDETYTPKGSGRAVVYQVIDAERIKTAAGILPVMPTREFDPERGGIEPVPLAPGQEALALLDADERLLVGGSS